MNDREATHLLHDAAGTIDVRTAPVAEIASRGARARRRCRAVSTVLVAAVLLGAVVAGTAVLRLDRSGTPADTPSRSREQQLVLGRWRPLTLFGKDVRTFRTVDGTPAYVTFHRGYVEAEEGYNSGGARYRVGASGRLTTRNLSMSLVGCGRRDGRACPTARNAEALEAARRVQVRGDRLQLLDDGDDVIATYQRAR